MSRADSPLFQTTIFNVGARRSGTFWLQRIVAAHPEVTAVPSETHLFSHGIAPLTERFHHGAKGSAAVGSVFVDRAVLLDALRDLCDTVLLELAGGEEGWGRIAERTPLHVRHLALMADVYPDARFVHIVRDGRDAARSLAAQSWGPGDVASAAAEWRDSVQAAIDARLDPAIYREIRYEALLADPETEVRALYRWLELPDSDAALAAGLAAASREENVDPSKPGVGSGKWRDAWGDQELGAFQGEAGELLAKLGYATDDVIRVGLPAPPKRRLSLPRRRAKDKGVGEFLQREISAAGTAVDAFLEALHGGRDEALAATLAADASVSYETGVSAQGADAVVAMLREDAAFTSRQHRGDLHPAFPAFTAVLEYALGRRVLVLTVRDEHVALVSVYT